MLSVFQKKKSNENMLTRFVNNVVIIDDNDSTDQKLGVLEHLQSVIKNQDIAVSCYSPAELKGIKLKKNKQLIFLDLCLNSSKNEERNIQEEIRPLLKRILPADFGNYGIIMWTKHIDYVEFLKEKIQEDKTGKKYPSPLFIVGLDKMKYITTNNFDSLFADIEDTLKQNIAATFFLEWSNSVQQAQSETISKIYSLMPNYKIHSDDMIFILTKLALNYTGIDKSQVGTYPLHIDAFKAFDEILIGELINSHISGSTTVVNTAKTFSNLGELSNIYAYLNSAILIDCNNLDQNVVIPGNIYEIQGTNSPFISDMAPKNVKSVVFEITPPCDFSDSKKRVRARLIGGFLILAESEPLKQIEKLKCKKESFYSEVYPIIIRNIQNPQILILDFRYLGSEEDVNLKDSSKYKILFRAKSKLFADILQKFSTHAARLGLSVIHS